ncbi:MAG: GAF domain-containing protein, partial [Armatimonadia bacterium]
MPKGHKVDALGLKQMLEKMTSQLVADSSPAALYQTVVRIAMETSDAEACSLYLEDPAQDGQPADTISMVAGAGFEEHRLRTAHYQRGRGLTGTIWSTSASIKCDSTEEVQNPARGWVGDYDGLVTTADPTWVCRSLIGVPLRMDERTIGVLKVENKRSRPCFSDEDQMVLEIVASTMALAIENRRISERDSQAMLRAIHEVSGMLVSDLAGSFHLLCAHVVDTCIELFRAEAASLYLEQPLPDGAEPEVIRMVAGAGYEVLRIGAQYHKDEGLTGSIWRDGEAVTFASAEELEDCRGPWCGLHDDLIKLPGWRCTSLIGVPLRVGERTIGVLKVENKQPTPDACFSFQELQTLQIIASNIAVAIQMMGQHRRIFWQGESARAQAHDLVNPAKGAQLNCEHVKSALQDTTPLEKAVPAALSYLELMQGQLDTLVPIMANMAHPAPAHRTVTTVQEVVRDLRKSVDSILRNRGIVLDAEVPIEPIPVEVDRRQLMTALCNLVDNAQEAMLTEPDKSHRLLLRVASSSELIPQVGISIIDSGPGVTGPQLLEFNRTGRMPSGKSITRGSGVQQAYRFCHD